MVALLAAANGANDNFKGVASLWGSRTLGYKVALAWATLTVLAGSIASLLLATTLTVRFTGKGLVPDALVGQTFFLTSVGIAAGITVVLASRLGFPISTTHALLGGLVGAGISDAGMASIRLEALGKTFVLPLLLSPLLAGAAAAMAYAPLRAWRKTAALDEDSCLCVGEGAPAMAGEAGIAMQSVGVPVVQIGQPAECAAAGMPEAGAIRIGSVLDAFHLLASGCVGFFRGMNDTPKIAALLSVAPVLGGVRGVALVAVVMAIGGLVGSRRVASTLSWNITSLNAGQATVAAAVTACLVAAASRLGLPVSTTHVACGALFGIGSVSGTAQWGTIRGILLSWCVTLPVAGVLGYALASMLR
jgi:PiT family inorganic phosphate transporter